jgi:hypothetical protein
LREGWLVGGAITFSTTGGQFPFLSFSLISHDPSRLLLHLLAYWNNVWMHFSLWTIEISTAVYSEIRRVNQLLFQDEDENIGWKRNDHDHNDYNDDITLIIRT